MRLFVNGRRARRRALAVWTARYRLDASEPWHDCQVLDVSEDGIGLELHGPLATKGAEMILELQQRDLAFSEERQSRLDDVGFAELKLENLEPVGVELHAVVRHSTESADSIRVGAEFATLSPLERSALTLLIERESLLASM
jgi:PilZ domain